MSTKIHWLTFVFIATCFIINPQSSTASTSADVKYDGKRLSVHASGVPLEQLLSMVEKYTGIEFSYDDLLAKTNVYANFENNSLDEGVRRILLQFNYAVIYNGSGHMRTILVLDRRRASSKNPADQTELYASQQQTDIDDIPVSILEPVETPPNPISIALSDQEDAPPFSGEVTGQGTSESDIPTEAKENVIARGGASSAGSGSKRDPTTGRRAFKAGGGSKRVPTAGGRAS